MDLREKLADLEHDRWSRWMSYLFSKCTTNEAGEKIIPVESVKHWQRQVTTPYSQLTEREKDSDRKEADNTLEIVKDYYLPSRADDL